MRWPALKGFAAMMPSKGPLHVLQSCVSEVQDKTALQQTMEEVKLAGLSSLTRKGFATALALWHIEKRTRPECRTQLPTENSTTLSSVRFACLGDQQAQAILKVMSGLSQEDIAAVAGAWAAVGGRARRQIE